MEFTSQVSTTIEQSERLLALGIKRETADMSYLNDKICAASYNEMECPYDNLVKPAWSLNRLIEMMPQEIFHEDSTLILGVFSRGVYYADGEYAESFEIFDGNLYDCIIKCIDWLIKKGFFNKEYLKED